MCVCGGGGWRYTQNANHNQSTCYVQLLYLSTANYWCLRSNCEHRISIYVIKRMRTGQERLITIRRCSIMYMQQIIITSFWWYTSWAFFFTDIDRLKQLRSQNLPNYQHRLWGASSHQFPTWNIGTDTNIEIIVVSLTAWEALHCTRAKPSGCGELPRSLMRQQWPKLRYQVLSYHDETKLMINKQILSI